MPQLSDSSSWRTSWSNAPKRTRAGTDRLWRASDLDRLMLDLFRRELRGALLAVRAGELAHTPPNAVATIHFRDRWTLARVVLQPALEFGEAYSDGRLDVEGDLVQALVAMYRAAPGRPAGGRLGEWWARVKRAHRPTASHSNVHHHYDLGNDFYRLWLDPELLYTCGYYPTPVSTLAEAQLAKMEYVCRKLALKPGDRVVEAGCGWGSLALHMARHHGARVKAYNLSREQVSYARDRARREGLEDHVEFVQADYRAIEGTFDAFVSVGMLEHVGLEQYRGLGALIDRVLAPAGRGLLHFIGRNYPHPVNPWIRRHIFPGGYVPALAEVLPRVFQPYAFSVTDVENLRLHYARTLAHWRAAYEARWQQVTRMFDERFARIWRLYLAGSEAAFLAGSMQLFQVVFARGTVNTLPVTRDHLYLEPLSPSGGRT
jgi:cyclopropane-fatty-acyl-phospholipid synthase